MPRAQHRTYAAVFLLTLALLMGAAALLTTLAPNYGAAGFNFFAMDNGQVLDLTGLDRKQTGSLKFGFLQQHAPPKVGIFGNHVVQYFTVDDFEKRLRHGEFFNFWYANLGLPEIYHALSFLKAQDKLPTDLVLIQITTPNNDMGRHIIDWGGELPDEFVNPALLWNEGPILFADWLISHYFRSKLKTTFNINKLRAIAGQLGAAPVAAQLQKRIISTAAYLKRTDSNPVLLSRSYRPDGSFDHDYQIHQELIRNGDSGKRPQRIFWGDEAVIAHYIQAIHDLCAEKGPQGRKVAFLVPPVYESDRDTEVDRIFNAALTLLDGVSVLDYRTMEKSKQFFYLYDHPSNLFYKRLVRDMEALGLLTRTTR